MGLDYQQYESLSARQKSYVGPAIITWIAYGFFWLPGIIFNLMYLSEANKMQKKAGESLPGVWCLWVLLISNVLWVACGFLVVLMLLAGGSS